MAWIETHITNRISRTARVATREGGVDRNTMAGFNVPHIAMSPPARVAWIETDISENADKNITVATREGGVDRNILRDDVVRGGVQSPPARVAWIETSASADGKNTSSRRHPRGWRG